MDHRKRFSLALVMEDQDDDNPDYEYSLFNYKPRFCDMQSPQSSSKESGGMSEIRSRSASMLLPTRTPLSSSVLENYVIPRDVKKIKQKTRTMSFSTGSGHSKYAMIREKYQNTVKSRATASSLSTSSSSSSVSSTSSPQSSFPAENEEETELFWNRYRRQDTKKQSIGKLIKRALSINIKSRPVRNSKSQTSVELLDRNNEDQKQADDLYDEVYQDIFYQGLHQNKSNLKNRSMSEIVL